MNPAATHQLELGRANLERVRTYFREHLCATNRECAQALGLGVMAVGRHVKTIRDEWLAPASRIMCNPIYCTDPDCPHDHSYP